MEKIKTIGRVHVKVIGSDGLVKVDCDYGTNIITNAGKAAEAGLIGNTGGVSPFTYLALGTSNTAVAATDTTLGAEITDTGLARASATVSRITTSVANDTLQLTYTWTASGVKTIQETGVFNASSSGVMLGRKVLSPSITTANTDLVIITYTVQLT